MQSCITNESGKKRAGQQFCVVKHDGTATRSTLILLAIHQLVEERNRERKSGEAALTAR